MGVVWSCHVTTAGGDKPHSKLFAVVVKVVVIKSYTIDFDKI